MNIWLVPDRSLGKESVCNAGDPSSIPRSGRSAGEGIGYPLQYSWASVVSQLVKKKISLQCRRPGFDPWVRKIPWGRERLSTPVFWPGELHGLYNPEGRKESDMTERLSLTHSFAVKEKEHDWRKEKKKKTDERKGNRGKIKLYTMEKKTSELWIHSLKP